MERETKKITTKSGIEVELITYLTGREMILWRGLFLDYFKTDIKGKMEDVKIEGKLLAEMEKRAIEIAIVSVGGSKDNIVQKIEEFPLAEYREVVDEAMKVMEDASDYFAKKK